jgi:phage terminase large subunit-like protein
MEVELPEDFAPLFEPHRYKAYFGGRGSAKSHSFAAALLIEGAQKRLRILCAREVQLSIKDSVKQLLDDKIEGLGLGGFYESIQNEIRGRNGTTFIFAGLGKMTADQIKSMEGIDRVWVEEAQTISASSLEILIPTIRKSGSELWFSWNPRHPSDPIDQRFRGVVVPENAVIKRVNYDSNPFFPAELTAEREFDRLHKPERYGHVWLGEYEPMAVGAIWDRATIHEGRRAEAPDLERIVVAVDPAISSGTNSDEHGIVICALGADGRGYVLDDVSMKGSPHQWATRAIAAHDRYEADAIVIEVNQGGDMVRHTLNSVRPGLKIVEVRATRGKHVRAEPISALYSLGRISHVGAFPQLEDQMMQMTAGGYEGDGSPDRVDALVWALTELFPRLTTQKTVKVRVAPMGPGGWMG